MPKQTKYQQAARGQSCKLRLKGCSNQVDTVVLCHMPSWINKLLGNGIIGWALKSADEAGVDACHHCHDILDRRAFRDILKADIIDAYNRGVEHTIKNRKQRGIIQ